LVSHHSRDADPAGLGQGFKTRRDIHPVPENVVLLNNHVAEIA
jgi:hypothetical protein